MILDWSAFVPLVVAMGCLALGQCCLIMEIKDLRHRLVEIESYTE